MSVGTLRLSSRPSVRVSGRWEAPIVVGLKGDRVCCPGTGVVELLNGAARDTLDELLGSLKVSSSVYCLSDFRAPWGFSVAGQKVAKFHLVLEGRCWLRLDDAGPERLDAGDLVIMPNGEGHTVTDEIDSPATGLDEILAEHPPGDDARLSYGGEGDRTRLLCGGFV